MVSESWRRAKTEAVNRTVERISASGSGRPVLVTGGAGFIGSHLAEALLSSGRRVRVIDDLSTGRMENIAHLLERPGFTFRRARVEDEGVLEELAEDVETIFHLAAAVGVRLVIREPARTIENNLAGARCVLSCARKCGARALITSSSEVYGKGRRVPFREEQDVLLGSSSSSRWSYAVSKLAEEYLGLAYHRQYGVGVVLVRLFNTIGARQTGRYGMVVPRFVRQALAGRPITVFGDGLQTRSFCDVRDVVECLLGLHSRPGAEGRVFNVGGQEEIGIGGLAERIKRLTGSRSEVVQVPYEEAYGEGFEDLKRRVPDISRIERFSGWRPRRPLDETLSSVIEHERRTESTPNSVASETPSADAGAPLIQP